MRLVILYAIGIISDFIFPKKKVNLIRLYEAELAAKKGNECLAYSRNTACLGRVE